MVSRVPILQTCNVVVVLVPTSAQFFAVSTFLILRSPSWTRSCIQKYCVSMCFVRSQSIRQKNSPSSCHFVFQSTLEFPDLDAQISGIVQLDLLSPLRKTPLLRRSMQSSSETLIQISQCGSRSEPNPPRDWVARKVAVHEDCDLVNMLLSSTSQRCCGLSHQISRCTFQRDKVKFTRLAHSLGQMFRCFSKIQSVLGQV